ncbi:Uncharacterised protein [uncultured archaeon]|nr:Uncharacterised protein [uncultured archaeon]
MDFKSFLAGILAAYGLVNLLAVFKISIFVSMPVVLLGFDVGNILLSLLALGIAFLLLRD